MKTAEEIKRQLSISDHPTDCICKQCKGGTELFLTDENIEAIQNEAIAHGMTISAEIVQNKGVGIDTVATPSGNYRAFKYRGNPVENILTARDNKVWRKE